jgi:hypothetical protein
MKGLGRNTRFKKPHGYSGGGNPRNRKNYANKGATEIGQEAQSYKEYVKTMFGGGITSPDLYEILKERLATDLSEIKYKKGGKVSKD